MNPLGLGLAFVLFWVVIGLGLFITFSGLMGLGKGPAVSGITARHSATRLMRQFGHAILLAIGLGMVVAGGYAIYAVIYR